MKNEHIPFELIEQIHLWIEKNVTTPDEDYDQPRKEKLAIIQQTINNLRKLSLDTPEDLFAEERALKELLSTPSQEKQIMLAIIEKLQELIKYVKQNIPNKGSTPKRGPKAPPKTLCVTLQTGDTIIENTAVMTFLKTLKHMGLERIAEIPDIRLHGHPVVSRIKNSQGYGLKKVEGFFIETHCSTNKKRDILKQYANLLGLHIQVAVHD